MGTLKSTFLNKNKVIEMPNHSLHEKNLWIKITKKHNGVKVCLVDFVTGLEMSSKLPAYPLKGYKPTSSSLDLFGILLMEI